ncbi:hypothetical protein FB451DRAFT_1308603, partial [Mycena latifolia]
MSSTDYLEPFLEFERTTLARWYTVVFALMPQITIIVAGLLGSNREGDEAHRL